MVSTPILRRLAPPGSPRPPFASVLPAKALLAKALFAKVLRAVALPVVMLLAVAPAAAEQTLRLDPTALDRAGVVTAPVGTARLASEVRVVGRVVRSPGSTVTVNSLLGGRIEAILVAPGDRVGRGQPLLRTHSHELHEREGELLSAREALRLAENRLAAGQRLWEVDGISRLDLERREQEVLDARIRWDRARTDLLHLDFTEAEIDALLERGGLGGEATFKAPVAGTVLSLEVQEHTWVEPFTPLLVLGDPADVELELQLSPEAAPAVAAGDRVRFHPVGRPEATTEARVISRVPQVDPTTRTVTVRAAIGGGGDETVGGEALFPGVFVEGRLTGSGTGGSSGAGARPVVPETAVSRLGGDDVVFVETGPGRFAVRRVELGERGSRDGTPVVAVVSGLAPGERVAVEGVFSLKAALVRGGGAAGEADAGAGNEAGDGAGGG